jgi:hypothetical protein
VIGGDVVTRSTVIDTNGRAVTGDVTIELRPGIGVTGPTGEHLDRENGPHRVPVAFAMPLIMSGRARVLEGPKESEKEKEVPPDAQVKGAPKGVQQRDPKPERR